MTSLFNPSAVLQEAGLRVTAGRLKLLSVLAKERKPRTIDQLERKMKGELNRVTLYRAMEALAKAGIVARINLEHEHAHFELAVGRPHHHHAVCRDCGRVEDIKIPHPVFSEAIRRATEFARIDRYSLEFFGICRQCA